MFGGIDIFTVEAGTVIEHGGAKIEITETNAVHKGNKIYMTSKRFELLKKHPDVKTQKSPPTTQG